VRSGSGGGRQPRKLRIPVCSSVLSPGGPAPVWPCAPPPSKSNPRAVNRLVCCPRVAAFPGTSAASECWSRDSVAEVFALQKSSHFIRIANGGACLASKADRLHRWVSGGVGASVGVDTSSKPGAAPFVAHVVPV
jgi:hypothetical protein